jgi:hypothetical protein
MAPSTKKLRNPARINSKRTKLLKRIAAGDNIAEAGRKAGYGRPQSAHYALNRMGAVLPALLLKLGIPPEKILLKFKQKLEAKETQFWAKEGIVTDSREVEAHDVQLHAADSLARIWRITPRNNGVDEEGGQVVTGLTINVGLLMSPEAGKLLGEPENTGKELAAARVVDEHRNS